MRVTIQPVTLMGHTIRATSLFLALAAASTPALADFPEFSPGFPVLFNGNNGTINYDPQANLLLIEETGGPSAARMVPGGPPRLVQPTGDPPDKNLQVAIYVDCEGQLIGGVDGDDLLITGAIDADGDGTLDFEGELLRGEILDFGYVNTGGDNSNSLGRLSTDLFEFRFALTGGSLLEACDGDTLAMLQTCEMSNFVGSFAVPFLGESKGFTGPERCVGDHNSNGHVDVTDLVEVLLAWGTPLCTSDIEGPTSVLHLVEVIQSWGDCHSE